MSIVRLLGISSSILAIISSAILILVVATPLLSYTIEITDFEKTFEVSLPIPLGFSIGDQFIKTGEKNQTSCELGYINEGRKIKAILTFNATVYAEIIKKSSQLENGSYLLKHHGQNFELEENVEETSYCLVAISLPDNNPKPASGSVHVKCTHIETGYLIDPLLAYRTLLPLTILFIAISLLTINMRKEEKSIPQNTISIKYKCM